MASADKPPDSSDLEGPFRISAKMGIGNVANRLALLPRGHDGGRIVFEGTPADLAAARSTLTGEHLAAYAGP